MTTLTRERVMGMGAGRELDALVAEHIFGWLWIRFKYELGGAQGPERAFQAQPEDFGGFFDTHSYMLDDGKYPRETHASVPHYSTDIAGAWQIIDHFQSRGIHANLLSDWHGNWTVEFWEKDKPLPASHEWSPTVMLAICKAALLTTIEP